jgi:hypothetical protein
MNEEIKYKQKCKELSDKIKELEKDNQTVQLKIAKTKKNIKRLKIERSMIVDRLDELSSDTSVSIQLQPTVTHIYESSVVLTLILG